MFRLAHLSDIHHGPLPSAKVGQLMSKRVLGYANWHRSRSRRHRVDILASIVDHVHAMNHDHIVVTGDLVNIALPLEFEAAAAWLETLGTPHDVSVIPGNHDAYVPVPAEQGFLRWRDYMSNDLPHDNSPPELFPYIRHRGPLCLIGVSSGVPSPFFRATGELGTEQLCALQQILRTEGEKGGFRVLMIHHPPHAHASKARKRLLDSRQLLDILNQEGCELVLYGHNHRFDLSWMKGPTHIVPAVGVPSASMIAAVGRHDGGYHSYEFEKTGSGLAVRMTRYGADDGGKVGQIGETIDLSDNDLSAVSEILHMITRPGLI